MRRTGPAENAQASADRKPTDSRRVEEIIGTDEEAVGGEEVGREEVGREEVGREEVGREEVGREEVGGEQVGEIGLCRSAQTRRSFLLPQNSALRDDPRPHREKWRFL